MKGKITFISEPKTLANDKVKYVIQLDSQPKNYDCWDLKGKNTNDDIEYKLKESVGFNDTITIMLPKSFSSSKNQTAENARTALLVAKDFVIAGKSGDKKTTEIADGLFAWLEKKCNS